MILGLAGQKGSGKDTAARYLCNKYGYRVVHFADLLKKSAAETLDVDPEAWEVWKNDPAIRIEVARGEFVLHSLTAREYLQRYGTEAHRDVFRDDFWIHALGEKIVIDTNVDYAIADVRFPNEATWITEQRLGKVVEICRGDTHRDTHLSEVPLPDDLLDYKVDNNGSFNNLYRQLDAVIAHVHG